MRSMSRFLDGLDRTLANHPAANEATNPVAHDFDAYSLDAKLYILAQYSLFSRYIVNFLTEVSYKVAMAEYGAITAEIQKNISEELGKDGSAAHYILLVRGLERALGLDLYACQASFATRNFKTGVLAAIRDGNGQFAAGAAYALESSATPELEMTYHFMVNALQAAGKDIDPELRLFFSSHVDEIEVAHKNRLREASIEDLQRHGEWESYADGFREVLDCLDSWWTHLRQEAAMIKPNL